MTLSRRGEVIFLLGVDLVIRRQNNDIAGRVLV